TFARCPVDRLRERSTDNSAVACLHNAQKSDRSRSRSHRAARLNPLRSDAEQNQLSARYCSYRRERESLQLQELPRAFPLRPAQSHLEPSLGRLACLVETDRAENLRDGRACRTESRKNRNERRD